MLQKKSVLIVLLAAGLLLLLWPRSSGSGSAGKNEDVSTTEEKRLCAVLSKIDGVGEVYALLSEEPNRRGEYTGAVVVCSWRKVTGYTAPRHTGRERLHRSRQQPDHCGRIDILGG